MRCASVPAAALLIICATWSVSGNGQSGSDTPASTPEVSGPLPVAADDERLVIEVTQIGRGTPVRPDQRVLLHYVVALPDGRVVQSTKADERPETAQINEKTMISGMYHGLQGMRVGGRRTLHLPASMGYGPTGVPGRVPPNSALRIEVEIIDLVK